MILSEYVSRSSFESRRRIADLCFPIQAGDRYKQGCFLVITAGYTN